MSEIEKMYENAGVKKINIHQSEIDNGDPRFTGISHSDSYIQYPPFTAEKQLNLIKWLANLDICLNFYDEEFYLFTMNLGGYEKGKDFLTVLTKYINNRWTNFDEAEKEQIREILK